MKKLIAILIVLMLMFAAFPGGASASGDFTAEDAMKLFDQAELLYLALEQGFSNRVLLGESELTRARVNVDYNDYKDNVIKEKLSYYDDLPDYYHYKVISYSWGDTTIPINNRSDLYKWIEQYFTKDAAKKVLDDMQNRYTENPYYDFVTTPFFFDSSENVYRMDDHSGPQFYVWYEVQGHSNFICNGETASIELVLGRGRTFEVSEYIKIPVEFVKTDAGWRISKDIFNTILHNYDKAAPYSGVYKEYLIENPNTSDSTVPAIAILGTVAVISLALPIVLYRRRRRAA